MKIEARPWKPKDLLDDLQSIIDEEPDRYLNTRRSTLCMARDYLKEYFLSLPNDPLTMEELREMDGEPVYIRSPYLNEGGEWGIVETMYGCDHIGIRFRNGLVDVGGMYGLLSTGKIYRRRPEERSGNNA